MSETTTTRFARRGRLPARMTMRGRAGAAIAIALIATAAPAMAATVYVANNGSDGVSCGTKESPCRSITQGVAKAVDGDRVSVGPGIYGDIDNDGALGGVGEEPLADCGGESCMISVTKLVDVVSEAGAFATLIRPPVGAVDQVVVYGPPGAATFGGKGRGFTIDGAGAQHVIVGGFVGSAIVGNVILASGQTGIIFVGSGLISANRVICLAGSDTFGIFPYGTPASTLTDNATIGCDVGVVTFGDINVSSSVAIGSRIGIGLDGASSVTKSLVAGNWQAGITVTADAGATSITGSSVIGNGFDDANCGIDVNSTASVVTDIWYGASTGPGADPADQLCDSANVPSPTFVDKAIKVKLKPIR